MKKNILLISPEPWSHISVSKHHYALELAKRGHHIFFLNPPNSETFKKVTVQACNKQPGITLIDYPGQVKGLRFMPAFIRVLANRRFLANLELLIGKKIDIIWNFENSRFFDFQFAGRRVKIYHQVDLNQMFNLKEAASSADICFCTTDLIKNAILPYNRKVYKIHHGTASKALEFPYSIREGQSSIKAVYIGNLDMAFMDRALLSTLIASFPNVIFQLIGPYDIKGDTYQSLKSFKNINWLGKQSAEQIPVYLNDADVLMVLYAERFHKDQASPHKFMEYFASGRVIVATYTDEYKDKRNLLVMSEKQTEYLSQFKRVIENLELYNSITLQQIRKAFAAENAYSKQVQKILDCCRQNNLDFTDE